MEHSVHNPKKLLNYWIKKINGSNISKKNKKLILNFRDECFSRGLSYSRIVFYIKKFLKIDSWITKDFDKLNEDDVKALIRKIEQMDYSPHTKFGYKETIKKFLQFLAGFDWKSKEFPDNVKWLKLTMKNNQKKLPEEILSKEDVMKLISVCKNDRDRAMVSVLYESGCRIGEFLNMKLKHVEFDDYGCLITVMGKTGSRRIRLVSSVPHLNAWLESHPFLKDKEAYVWNRHDKSAGRISYFRVNKILKNLAEKARIQKRVNPHAFRHARATHLASKLTEAQMKEYFGWTQSSKMASVYVHLSGRDVDDAILKMHGILPEEEVKNRKEIEVKECLVCHERNSFKSKYCRRCGTSLDPNIVKEIQQRERELFNMITPEIIEKMIEEKVKQMLKSKMS